MTITSNVEGVLKKLSAVELTCTPDVSTVDPQWMKDGVLLKVSPSVTYSIKDATYQDTGFYVCIFSSDDGLVVSLPFEVKVAGK